MEEIYVIRDIERAKYYWSYREENAFSGNIEDADHFDSEEEAVKTLNEEHLEELFYGRHLEIKRIFFKIV